jgi:hypothetical protein
MVQQWINVEPATGSEVAAVLVVGGRRSESAIGKERIRGDMIGVVRRVGASNSPAHRPFWPRSKKCHGHRLGRCGRRGGIAGLIDVLVGRCYGTLPGSLATVSGKAQRWSG